MTSPRTALVTGGSRGIGAAIVQALQSDGWRVLSPSRSELNLSELSSVTAYVTRQHLPLSGLVLNAGISHPAPVGGVSLADWQNVQDVNVTSGFALLSAIAPDMAQVGFGRIVALSSAYATRARPGRSAYSSSKAAIEALVRSVAVEFASFGVTANCVAPGFVDTDLTRQNNTAADIAQLVARVPAGRLASVDEIAAAVSFLMSPSNTYITGQTLAVDGGLSCT